MFRRADLPYVLPFCIFLVIMAVRAQIPYHPVWEYPLRVVFLAAMLYFLSRHVIDLRVRSLLPTIGIGCLVFVLWIAPDLLWPGYRQHWLFQNSITGSLKNALGPGLETNVTVLLFRTIRAAVLVPIIEELFWRAWLMRWLVNVDVLKVPLGAYTRDSFWIVALLFASEHGPYWDVGLMAGVIYNWWMVRTRSLGDCILAHAVTNLCLSAYVIGTGHWEYWL